jgi:putative hydrolase of the HAD superfamily
LNKITTIISDLGGVFLTRGIWLFWDYLNSNNNVALEESKRAFLLFYKDYFSGKISEADFWQKFLQEIHIIADWQEMRTLLLNKFELNPGIDEMYANYRQKGYKLVLLSDQTKEWWPFLDSKFQISKQFDHVIISAEIGINKPDPEIYKYALLVSGSKAQETIFIDDLQANLIPASELGIHTVLYTDLSTLGNTLSSLTAS